VNTYSLCDSREKPNFELRCDSLEPSISTEQFLPPESLPALQCDGHVGIQGDSRPRTGKQSCRADRARGSRQEQRVWERKANPWQAQCQKVAPRTQALRAKGWQKETPTDPDCTPVFCKGRESLSVVECQGDKLKSSEAGSKERFSLLRVLLGHVAAQKVFSHQLREAL